MSAPAADGSARPRAEQISAIRPREFSSVVGAYKAQKAFRLSTGRENAAIFNGNPDWIRRGNETIQQRGSDMRDVIFSARLDFFNPILAQGHPTAQPQGAKWMGRGDQNCLTMPATEIGQDDVNGIHGQHISQRLEMLLTLGTDEVVSAWRMRFRTRSR
jgi:hypothetical protein